VISVDTVLQDIVLSILDVRMEVAGARTFA
jgi:hypothetical protein